MHPSHGILLSSVKGQIIDTHSSSLGESPENDAERKKPISKGYKLCDSVCRIFLKGENYRNRERISGCQDSERARGWDGKEEDAGKLRDPCGYVSVMWHHRVALRSTAPHVTSGDKRVKGTRGLSLIS